MNQTTVTLCIIAAVILSVMAGFGNTGAMHLGAHGF
jgi:hypothetical protein